MMMLISMAFVRELIRALLGCMLSKRSVELVRTRICIHLLNILKGTEEIPDLFTVVENGNLLSSSVVGDEEDEEGNQGEPVENGFWEYLRIVLEHPNCDEMLRQQLLSIFYSLLKVAHRANQLGHLVATMMNDRRIRRKFIATHLVALFHNTNSVLPTQILSLLFATLAVDPERYVQLLEECYEQLSSMTHPLSLCFLAQLAPFVRIDLALLVLERRFRLGKPGSRQMPLQKVLAIFDGLVNVRLDDDTNINELFICQLLRLTIVSLFAQSHFSSPQGARYAILDPDVLSSIRQRLFERSDCRSFQLTLACIDNVNRD